MRKLFSTTLMLLAMSLFFISCRSNDDSPQPTIVGSWQPTTMKISGTLNGQAVSQTITANTCQMNSRSVFNADGTGVNRTWTDTSGTCTQSPDLPFTYTYNAQTKALSVTSGGSTQNGTVNSLTDTQLVFSMPATYDFNGQNIPVTLEITATRVN